MRRLIVLLVLCLVAVACGDSAADPDRFCEINAELDEQEDFFELPPDEAREVGRRAESLIREIAKVAPDEIKTSAQVLSDASLQIFEVFEAADFDAAQIDEADIDAAFEAAFSEDVATASDEVDAWTAANCN